MIILGIILLIIGFVAKIAIVWTIGIIALVVGLILLLLGSMGRAPLWIPAIAATAADCPAPSSREFRRDPAGHRGALPGGRGNEQATRDNQAGHGAKRRREMVGKWSVTSCRRRIQDPESRTGTSTSGSGARACPGR